MLRNHWPGSKPILAVTANKSHAGKDTVIAFATNEAQSTSISYQAKNWAFERNFVGALKTTPDTAVIVVENARLDYKDRVIASAFLERFTTDPYPFLFSTGTGAPLGCGTISSRRSQPTTEPLAKISPIGICRFI